MTMMEQGIQHMNEQQYEEAAKCFTSAIEENPKDPTGYINFGNLLGIVGDFERSLAFLIKQLN
ncbi:tetratricopeptide repeat family protein [Halalkalibacter hemicellulosilyticusJCM 9152]|uniref:Tetratricopeptide repeat family protein n=1 Tax=Halalkalibacter hemicellulosilyticusJCM 9152 TaxID=1236971 RepID=W4QJ97_9BACI|nr:tetratricopeptide repeat family protein [Halalkalibacter hemicellulosilyticusJCM 9152]